MTKRTRGDSARFVALVLFAPMMLTGCATFKAHPGFSMRHETMKDIAVMAPDVQAYEVTFNAGNQPLAELQELVKTKSASNIEELLKDKGYKVTGVQITTDQLEKNAALKEAWFDIQTLHNQALDDIKKNKKKEFTYEIGSGPNYFAENHKADVIVLTRQTATKLSQGMINSQIASMAASAVTIALVGVAVGGNAQPWFSLNTEIAFVDTASGDILWYNLETTTEDYTKSDEKNKVIFNHLQRILKPFPDSKFKKADDKTIKSVSSDDKLKKSDKIAAHAPGVPATNISPAVRK